ncbi:hypothetical protein BG004_005775 [Podila humilis]|nr:hypothetical protein BG004_005775 [Podila humilis]
MAIPNIFDLLESSNSKLTQSADSLESALAQFSKLAASIEQPAVSNNLHQNGGGFDSWLAAEFQYGALLGGDDLSSVAPSPSTISDESPLLELENLVSCTGPSLFESSVMTPDIPSVSASQLPITFSALQRAAAEINIPWSEELGLAYLARVQGSSVQPLTPSLPTLSSVSSPSISSPPSPVETSADVPTTSSPHTATAKKVSSPKKRSSSSMEEESEEVLAKRAKNTDAARRSRMKKVVKLETLEVKVQELETTNNRLNMRIAILETEKNNFLIKEAEQAARIAQLEAKVIEAHLALTNRA